MIAPTVLLTDRALGRSNTALAQGGLQVPFDTDRSRESLVRDMVISARSPVQLDRVERFVDEILPTVRRLEQWGLVLDRDERGELVRRTAGGLSEQRIVSARDQIGPALLDVLKRVLASSGADIHPGQRVVSVRSGSGGVELDVVSVEGRRSRPGEGGGGVQRRNQRPVRSAARRTNHQSAERERPPFRPSRVVSGCNSSNRTHTNTIRSGWWRWKARQGDAYLRVSSTFRSGCSTG